MLENVLPMEVLERLQANHSGYSVPEPPVEEVSRRLLSYLRGELGEPRLGYASPPARIRGGSDTYTYRFRLRGASPTLSRELVLRLCSPDHFAGRCAQETLVQGILARVGYPAAPVRFTCADRSVLGGEFLVMDLLPGAPLPSCPPERIPEMMARAHDALHGIDPAPLLEALPGRGPTAWRNRLRGELDGLALQLRRHRRFEPVISWLRQHRPPDPGRLSICHGDFHPLNLLARSGRVSGVLDWPAYFVADRAADVGSTMLFSVPARHLLSVPDPETIFDRYLDAYRERTEVAPERVDYYLVRRCLVSLVHGVNGRLLWRHPLIVRDLLQVVERITGIAVSPPEPYPERRSGGLAVQAGSAQ